MKGLYLSNLYEKNSVGYKTKILGQIHGLIAFGLEIESISFSETGHISLKKHVRNALDNNKGDEIILREKSKNIFVRRQRLLSSALSRIRKSSFDFLYIRYPRSDPFYLLFLSIVKLFYPKILIFSEFPTFPYDKELLEGNSLRHAAIKILDMTTRGYLKCFVDRVIAINYPDSIFGIQSIDISNGVDVDSFPLKEDRSILAMQHTINLLGVANVKPWHGYDRIILGLDKYYRTSSHNRKVVFHIVGACEPFLSDLKELSATHAVEDYVVFHPPAKGAVLDKLFDMSDIGVSTLGAHRIGLYELSPLKSREYCARGLPFLLGYDDPDFSEDFAYALKVPSIDSPIDIQSVVFFLENICKELDGNQKIRKYAVEKLDWAQKMSHVALEIANLNSNLKSPS